MKQSLFIHDQKECIEAQWPEHKAKLLETQQQTIIKRSWENRVCWKLAFASE